jgi:cysteine desulfurase/selenocysteine lyase
MASRTAPRTSIISFNLNQIEPEFAVEKLAKQNIILAVREIQEKKIIRASPHFFNSEKQVMQVIDALRKL